jgi:hypothetical protein
MSERPTANKLPSWLDDSEPINHDPRFTPGSASLQVIWADAVAADGTPLMETGFPASSSESTQAQESERPPAPPSDSLGGCVNVVFGTTFCLVVFFAIVATEFVRSYTRFMAWILEKSIKKTQEDQEMNLLRRSFILLFVVPFFIFFFIANVALLLGQCIIIEVNAGVAGFLCGLFSLSLPLGQYSWHRVRDVGHRTRRALDTRCSRHPDGSRR